MYSKQQLFDEDSDSFHDVLTEVLIKLGEQEVHAEPAREWSREQLETEFDRLPEYVRNIAHCWSLGDTVFRDDAYVWFVKNGLLPQAGE